MFDIGFSELVLTALVALIVFGPERLPQAARTAGLWIGRFKRVLADTCGVRWSASWVRTIFAVSCTTKPL